MVKEITFLHSYLFNQPKNPLHPAPKVYDSNKLNTVATVGKQQSYVMKQLKSTSFIFIARTYKLTLLIKHLCQKMCDSKWIKLTK